MRVTDETRYDVGYFVTITQNNSGVYSLEEIVSICKRINNPKRDFLLVNHLQGKHIHVNPKTSFLLYGELVHQITSGVNPHERIIVIGFAETATAIGQFIAYNLPNCIYYMQTTRENLENTNILVEFKEEHSHATDQILYGSLEVFDECDRIIFVDDEISTGNTILNFIRELNKIGINTKYSVASILNLQNEEWTEKFNGLDIDCFFVCRGIIKDINTRVDVNANLNCSYRKIDRVEITPTIVKSSTSNFTIERTGFKPLDVDLLYADIMEDVSKLLSKDEDSILVLGTEEYMFAPMVTAYNIGEVTGVNVQFHATTRSPIEISQDNGYAINSRFQITSCYDNTRTTYVYNLQKYDKVFIITDVIPNEEFTKDIISALVHVGCNINSIHLIVIKE